MPPPDARIWAGARHAGLDHEVQPVAQAEGDALEHGPGHVPTIVPERQADERAPRQRVGMRAALAGQVGQEEQAVGTGRDVGGRGDEVRERLAGGERVAEPAQAAGRGQHHRHQVPAIRDRVAERMDAARAARTTGGRSRRRRRPTCRATGPSCPATTTPTPTALAAWSPPPATTGVPARSPVAAAARSVTAPVTCGPFERRRQPVARDRRGADRTSADQSRAARSNRRVPEPSALSMAWTPVRRRRR